MIYVNYSDYTEETYPDLEAAKEAILKRFNESSIDDPLLPLTIVESDADGNKVRAGTCRDFGCTWSVELKPVEDK